MWKKDFQKRTLFFNFFRFFFYIFFFHDLLEKILIELINVQSPFFAELSINLHPLFLESSSFFFGDHSFIFKINFVYDKNEGKNLAIFYFEADRFSRSTKDRVNYYHSIWILDLIFQHFFSTIYPKFLQHKLFNPLLFFFYSRIELFNKNVLFELNMEGRFCFF